MNNLASSLLIIWLLLAALKITSLLWHVDKDGTLLVYIIIVFCLPFFGLPLIWLLESDKETGKESGKKSDKKSVKGSIKMLSTPPGRKSGEEIDGDISAIVPSGRLHALDIYAESDVTPSNEILMSADFSSRRKFLLDLLKNSTSSTHELSHVKTALQNDDLETVHYAASGMQHIRQLLEEELMTAQAEYNRNSENPTVIRHYAECIDHYINMLNPVGGLHRLLMCQQIRLLLHLLRLNDLSTVDRLIDLLMISGHNRLARTVSRSVFRRGTECENKYLPLLRYAFASRDRMEFYQTLDALRASDLIISDEALNIIRLWTGAMRH
jgi:hypothetical protein